jgi:5-methylcytosine-specific restriction protein B
MDIKKATEKILKEWSIETKKEFKGNELAAFIRNEFKSIVEKIIKELDNNLIVKASAGAGNWANVPWLSILDSRITNTTQDGVYPVYLFRADGSGFYLSLNQGTTNPIKNLGKKEAVKYTSSIALNIQNRYSMNNWNSDSIDLRSDTLLGKSYEDPNIYCKFYPINEIPNSHDLISDLNELLKVYNLIAESWTELKEDSLQIPKQERSVKLSNNSDIITFINNLKECGLFFKTDLIYRFVSCLQSKQFILLTGLSGSGKTKIAEAFSLWLCDSTKQICFVSVGADWTNRDPLLGFANALDSGHYVRPETGVLDLILDAEKDPLNPYFLILDEMNLSHVERYFADFLSSMESHSRKINLHPETDEWNGSDIPAGVTLPKNLFIIGTVNIDETTYMFSPKVLDRANVIEFRVSAEEMDRFFDSSQEINLEIITGAGSLMGESFVEMTNEFAQDDGNLKEELMPFFEKLQEAGAEFGYRTASEISTFVKKCTDLVNGKMTRDEIVDAAIMQKLLPKLHGSRNKIERILKDLGNLCLKNSDIKDFMESNPENIKYPVSYEKLQRMHKRVVSDGFTSYAEA